MTLSKGLDEQPILNHRFGIHVLPANQNTYHGYQKQYSFKLNHSYQKKLEETAHDWPAVSWFVVYFDMNASV